MHTAVTRILPVVDIDNLFERLPFPLQTSRRAAKDTVLLEASAHSVRLSQQSCESYVNQPSTPRLVHGRDALQQRLSFGGDISCEGSGSWRLRDSNERDPGAAIGRFD